LKPGIRILQRLPFAGKAVCKGGAAFTVLEIGCEIAYPSWRGRWKQTGAVGASVRF
jgi:hypothetical protein